ncbi:transposase [Ruegeria sp. HKCCD6157]|uniref:transposase n=1 Tax=Ruegeria sp. HKCCD6157 TaxID=2690707 RepID=UPI0014924A48|nr:transposase [Ruegeria sp. HKCCD6157]NOE28328.1 hypothetical protein [Ruegeria sp. HKCCD6157]
MSKPISSDDRDRIRWCQFHFALPPEGVATRFPTNDAAVSRVLEVRWPSGVMCLRCGSAAILHFEARKKFHCQKCRLQFSAKTGTILHGSNLPIRKWLLAAEYIITCHARGRAADLLTSHQLKDRIGLSYKVAHARRKDLMNDLTATTPGLIFNCICVEPVRLTPDLVPWSHEHLMWCRQQMKKKPV